MALVSLGSLIGAASGSVGACTFAQGAGGLVLRPRPLKKDSKSAAQIEQRSRYRAARASWGALTDAQRAAWRAYAQTRPATNRLGQARPLSAQALWISWAIWHSLAGFAAPTGTLPLGTTAQSTAPLQTVSPPFTWRYQPQLPAGTAPCAVLWYGARSGSLTPRRTHPTYALADVWTFTGSNLRDMGFLLAPYPGWPHEGEWVFWAIRTMKAGFWPSAPFTVTQPSPLPQP